MRGVYIFFNRTLNNANQKSFYLTIWDDNNGLPGNIIYSQIGEKPEFHGLNEFAYYNLDTTIYLTNNFYIGWIQTSEDLLNMGFDVNNDNSSKVFYNLSGNWQNCPYVGTPMMRPVLSSTPFVNINDISAKVEISIYPNPASDFINVNVSSDYIFQIFDITGRSVLETSLENGQINISKIPVGLYIIKGFNNKSQFTRKLIINR